MPSALEIQAELEQTREKIQRLQISHQQQKNREERAKRIAEMTDAQKETQAKKDALVAEVFETPAGQNLLALYADERPMFHEYIVEAIARTKK